MFATLRERGSIVVASLLILVPLLWPDAMAYAAETSWSAQTVVRLGPGEGFAALLGDLAKTSPDLKASVCNSIYVIFIPGILGTKLEKTDGTVVWGEGRPRLNDLDLGANPNLRPVSALESYTTFFGRTDIYRSMFDALIELASCSGSYASFAYDWRKDFDDSAKHLETFILNLKDDSGRPALRNKTLVFVAHSMGGLVLKEWLRDWFLRTPRENRQPKYGFKQISEVLFLGTPHEGSPTALYNLIEGYQDINGTWYENSVYKYLFSELHPVSFSFPSIYRLLPGYQSTAPILRYCQRGKCGAPDETAINHFNGEHWQHYDLASKIAPRTDTARNEFYKLIGKRLQVAQGKNERLAAFRIPDEIGRQYFFGDSLKTIRRMVLTNKLPQRSSRLQLDIGEQGGDGRVTIDSARHFSQTAHGRVAFWLTEEHGLLFADRRFRRALQETMSQQPEVVTALAKAIQTDPNALAVAAAETQFLVPFSMKLTSNRFLPSEAASISAYEANRLLIKTRFERGLFQETNWSSQFLETGDIAFESAPQFGSKDQAMYMAMYLVEKDDPAKRARATNSMGLAFMGSGDCASAEAVLARAKDPSESAPGFLINTYGLALECLGRFVDAASAFTLASERGSEVAKINLERVKLRQRN